MIALVRIIPNSEANRGRAPLQAQFSCLFPLDANVARAAPMAAGSIQADADALVIRAG